MKDPLTRSQRARSAAYVSWVKCSGKARSTMTTAVAERAWNVNTGNRVSPSKQQFVDCDIFPFGVQ